MSRIINLSCPKCGHQWAQDLDQAQKQRTIFRGDAKKTKVEVYVFDCPQDGTQVAVEVEVEV